MAVNAPIVTAALLSPRKMSMHDSTRDTEGWILEAKVHTAAVSQALVAVLLFLSPSLEEELDSASDVEVVRGLFLVSVLAGEKRTSGTSNVGILSIQHGGSARLRSPYPITLPSSRLQGMGPPSADLPRRPLTAEPVVTLSDGGVEHPEARSRPLRVSLSTSLSTLLQPIPMEKRSGAWWPLLQPLDGVVLASCLAQYALIALRKGRNCTGAVRSTWPASWSDLETNMQTSHADSHRYSCPSIRDYARFSGDARNGLYPTIQRALSSLWVHQIPTVLKFAPGRKQLKFTAVTMSKYFSAALDLNMKKGDGDGGQSGGSPPGEWPRDPNGQ
ncbi:hypothetical protein IWX50DRAFT_620028 [Phyllosticta citricarpa]